MRTNLKKQVEEILKQYPQSRDSDIWLTLKLWGVYYSNRIKKFEGDHKQYIALQDIMELPREDNIKRIRAKFQNELHLYLPTTWVVAKQRKIEEEVWREFIREFNQQKNG